MRYPRYGYRRITAQLKKDGWVVNHKRVLRVMRKESLLCHVKKAFKVSTTGTWDRQFVFPNLLHGLSVCRLNQVWVADITYIKFKSQFVYLAVILDRYSRRIIGWAIADHMEQSLTLAALEIAIQERGRPKKCIHHSDRGTQYASQSYVNKLTEHGIKISMSRKGNPYDNAAAESFMKTLKQEEVYLNEYKTLADVKNNVPDFLERIYNQERLHSSLDYNSPEEFELKLEQSKFRKQLKNQEIGANNLIP